MTRPRDRQRGVSLIEALVALLVMAVGLMGIAGVQSTLRSNGDVSKQRSEAVRLAQRTLEQTRAFTQVEPSGDPDVKTYDAIPTALSDSATGVNATYSIALSTDDTAVPGMKRMNVQVSWTDRAGASQTVTLNSSIARVAPEFAGTLAMAPPFGGERRAAARHSAIPRTAVDQGDGTSHFQPPGGGSVTWVFNNTTGAIIRTCNPVPTCTDVNALFLAGSIAFATGFVQPTPAQAEVPPSSAISGIEVSVARTYPGTATVACYENTTPAAVDYFCAVPVSGTDTPPRWSGQSLLGGALTLAVNAADTNASAYRVCRYTAVRSQASVGSTVDVSVWNRVTGNYDTVARTLTNADHPQTYDTVSTALIGQNFLVIRAGDGTAAFSCPDDATATPDVNGTTFDHQPAI